MEPANPGTRRDIIVSVGPCTRVEVEDAREMILAALAPHMDLFQTEARVLPKDNRILTAGDIGTITAPDPATVPRWTTLDWEVWAREQRELISKCDTHPLVVIAAGLEVSADRLEASGKAFELRMSALLERMRLSIRKFGG